ncbi:MAG: hypothetical protein M1827_006799 [Pycnora praestabilis]|nr:MAG: hypothetical protein M1827_006799 [Pycnora praestabilis]
MLCKHYERKTLMEEKLENDSIENVSFVITDDSTRDEKQLALDAAISEDENERSETDIHSRCASSSSSPPCLSTEELESEHLYRISDIEKSSEDYNLLDSSESEEEDELTQDSAALKASQQKQTMQQKLLTKQQIPYARDSVNFKNFSQ